MTFKSVDFDVVFARLYIVWDSRRQGRRRNWKIAKLALHFLLADANDFMQLWRLWTTQYPLGWSDEDDEEGVPPYSFVVQTDGGDWPTPGVLPEGLPERYHDLWPNIRHMMERHALQALESSFEDR